MKKDFIEALKAMDLSPSQVKSCADLYTACFESVHPLYEMKDTLTFGDTDTKGKRVGKSDRNIELARYKSKHPVTVRFHRTHSGNVDSIMNSGLNVQNDNYGRNTGDTRKYDNVVWTALNPDKIPVLREFDKKKPVLISKGKKHGYYDEDGNYVPSEDDEDDEYEYPYNPPARHRNNIDTLKITLDKDKYNKMDRRKLPDGRKSASDMFKVNEGESSVSREGRYKIDVFGEDIGKENLSLMKKEDERVLEEITKFIAWIRDSSGYWNGFSSSFDDVKPYLPSYILNTVNKLVGNLHNEYWNFNEVPIEKFKWVMNEIAKCIASHPYRISNAKYSKDINSGYPYTPEDLMRRAYVPEKSNRPWLKNERQGVNWSKGHISRAIEDTRNTDYSKKMSADLLDNVLRVAAGTFRGRSDAAGTYRGISDAVELRSIVLSFIGILPVKAADLFKPMGNVIVEECKKKAIEQKATDINKIYADTVVECYLSAKNSGLYDEWRKIYDSMVHYSFDEWMPKYGDKINIIKKLLEKKYTFKWAFCAGAARNDDKIFKEMQDILKNV